MAGEKALSMAGGWGAIGATLVAGLGAVSSVAGCEAVQGAIERATSDDGDAESKSPKKNGSKKKGEKKKGEKKKASGHRKPGKSGVVSAPDPGETIQPKNGAWVKYATKPKTEAPGTLTWSVVGRPEPTNLLIELEMASGPQRFITRADAVIVDLRDPDGNDFNAFEFKVPGHQSVTLPGIMQSQMKGTVAALFRIANPKRIEGAPQETVKVKAGTFEGCYKIRGPGVGFGVKQEATHWVHPAVPLPGIVKTVAAEGEMELHSYALSGAKSAF